MINSRMTLPLAAALLPALAAAPGHAAETAAERAWDRSATCLTAVQGGLEGGSRCLGDQVGRVLLDEAARFMTRQGRTAFGDGFRLVHRMSWSPLGNGLAGDLDAVIPLASRGSTRTGADPEQLAGSAFFLQQGVTAGPTSTASGATTCASARRCVSRPRASPAQTCGAHRP